LRTDILGNGCIWLSLANAMSWGGHGCVGRNWMEEIRFLRMNDVAGGKVGVRESGVWLGGDERLRLPT
jgi:hypothetical protein